jgi:hypothetical protein
VETAVLFLNTTKTSTLQHLASTCEELEWPLRFETPFYRSGVEALRRLPSDARARTPILGVQSGVLAEGRPRGCELCEPLLLGALMAHNFSRDSRILDHAASASCPCVRRWRDEFGRACALPLSVRVERGLDVLERYV